MIDKDDSSGALPNSPGGIKTAPLQNKTRQVSSKHGAQCLELPPD